MPIQKIQSRIDLDRLSCEMCRAGTAHEHANHSIVLHGRCHMESPTWVSYQPGSGILEVRCATCTSLVAQIHVGYPLM